MTATQNLELLLPKLEETIKNFDAARAEFQTTSEADKIEITKTLDGIKADISEMQSTVKENEAYFAPGAEPFNPETGGGFSLARAVNAVRTKNWGKAEYEQDVIKTMGMQTDAGGGFLVPENLAPGLIELLQARSIFNGAVLGVTELPGVGGAMKFNRVKTGVTVGMASSEGDTIAASDLAIEQFSLEPKTAAVRVKMSNLMLESAPAAAEMWFTTQAARDMAIKCDNLFLNGTGASGEPLGLLNDPDIGSFTTASGAITYLQLLDALGDLMAANAYFGRLGWAVHPTQRLEMLAAPGTTSVDVERRTLSAGVDQTTLGHPTEVSTAFAATTGANSGVFGAWDQSVIANFKGLEIRVSDEASDAFEKDETHVRLIKRFDTHRIQPSAFTAFA
jgi:HK97 family phage major capsid protein